MGVLLCFFQNPKHRFLQVSQNPEGKVFAEYVALGNEQDHDVEETSNILREQGARVISNVQYAVSPQWNIDSWTGMLSPSM